MDIGLCQRAEYRLRLIDRGRFLFSWTVPTELSLLSSKFAGPLY